MLASKSEKDALGAVLFFNLAHYVLRPWPWILVGLCSLIIYPTLGDIKTAFPNADVTLIGHDSAYPAMLRFLPAGWMGLMVGGLIAANSSTILTHLNWGSSYLVHDCYRRFVNTDATEKHYVMMGRLSTVVLFVFGGLLTTVLDSAKDAFNVILLVGAGTGLIYLVRWFWWRVNAWAEVAAMVSSFVISVAWLILHKNGVQIGVHYELLITIAITTVCWILTAYFGPATADSALKAFYAKVRPAGPGWSRIRRECGLTEAGVEAETGDNIPMALIGMMSGTAMIWSALFFVGNALYGRWGYATVLGAITIGSGLVMLKITRRVWNSAAEASALDTLMPEPVIAQSNEMPLAGANAL